MKMIKSNRIGIPYIFKDKKINYFKDIKHGECMFFLSYV